MNDEATLPLIEEVARIEREVVPTSKVTVRTGLEIETRHLEESLTVQTVEVERRPINQQVDRPPETRTEGNVTIIPIVEERLIVEKRLFLVEEVRITRSETVENVALPVHLRKQRAIIEKQLIERQEAVDKKQ